MEKTGRRLTLKQARAVDFRVRYPYKSEGWVLRQAGYKPYVARQPKKVFGSKAVQDALRERGFLTVQRHKMVAPKKVEVAENAHQISPQRIPLDPAKLSEAQLVHLKELLADVPDPQTFEQEASARPYDPVSGGLDPNTGEAPMHRSEAAISNTHSLM